MIIRKNLFGQDPAEYDAETAADRIGNRIRKIRIDRGLSQTELGERIGLSADRVQKYENGARKPKMEMLIKIADALGVSSLALSDPNTTSYLGAMYALFEIESTYGLKIEEKNNAVSLTVEYDNELYDYMHEWAKLDDLVKHQIKYVDHEGDEKKISQEYQNWKWNFPRGMYDKEFVELRKEEIKEYMEKLQKIYNEL
ncbi:MAG: helix-turn-helix transcriptional regulator [Dorea sp.]|nr:helix-turn-helix transcriptional regulator [uncultured Dorea sp.]